MAGVARCVAREPCGNRESAEKRASHRRFPRSRSHLASHDCREKPGQEQGPLVKWANLAAIVFRYTVR